jgi:hypothetical protein
MSQDPDPTVDGPNGPTDEEPAEEPDLEGEESFPASDPPAHWMGEDDRPDRRN